MDILFFVLAAILCLFVASFLHVAAFRIPKGKSIIYPFSHCLQCGHRLGPLDLIPIVSYVMLRGRCRYCQAALSLLYPIGEALTSILLLFTFYKIGWSKELWIALPLMMLLSTITISDLLYKMIPDELNLVGFIFFALIHIYYQPLSYLNYLTGALAGGGLLYLIAIASRGGMGGGDIKLMAVVGMAIGWKLTLLSFFLASLIGGFVGGLLLFSNRITRKETIPFGPFLAFGTFLSYFWGDAWIQAYLDYLFTIS